MSKTNSTVVVQSDAIALALSGGGVRAMAFHCGVLRYLAEQGKLEKVSEISTVSGGSLLVGLVFARSDMVWPSSHSYLAKVLPLVRQSLTTYDLQTAATLRLLGWPPNWRYMFSRANVFAQTIASCWKIRQCLADLPKSPVWSINGTTAETGKRFRFKGTDFGDYELGYASAEHFPLASAMAVSAAFPVGIGPLAIDSRKHKWAKRPEWNSTVSLPAPVILPYQRLHIYDGGVYDNLGLEPFFDAGRQTSKGSFSILASDAGMPLGRGFDYGALNPIRLGRLMDIVTDQTRSLRIRTFAEYLIQGGRGAYLQIGAPGERIIGQSGKPLPQGMDLKIAATQAEQARTYPTNLKVLHPDVFDLLERHGYEVAMANQAANPYL